MSETPLYTQMSNLLFYANNLTGEADEHLGDAIYKLGLGYGQGGDCVFFEKDISLSGVTSNTQQLATNKELTEAGVLYQANKKLADLWDFVHIKLMKTDANHTIKNLIFAEVFTPGIVCVPNDANNTYYGRMMSHATSTTGTSTAQNITNFCSTLSPAVVGFPALDTSYNLYIPLNATFRMSYNYKLYITCSGKKL